MKVLELLKIFETLMVTRSILVIFFFLNFYNFFSDVIKFVFLKSIFKLDCYVKRFLL